MPPPGKLPPPMPRLSTTWPGSSLAPFRKRIALALPGSWTTETRGSGAEAAAQIGELTALPRDDSEQNHAEQSARRERGDGARQPQNCDRGRCADEVMHADRVRHAVAEDGVAEEVERDAAAERDRTRRRQLVRRRGDRLLAADCEPDDACDEDVMDVAIRVA